MPLVRIAVRAETSPETRAQIAEGVHRAMVTAIAVPEADRFQIITEHGPDGLIYDPSYLGITRTDGIVIIQIMLNAGRSVDQKKALYAAIADNLEAAGIRRGDVFVNLVEVARENWSFGNGIAQYA